MTRLLKESFVPVLLVITAIFLLVYYSHYVADLDAEQVTVIEIPAQITLQSDEPTDESLEDEEMDHLTIMRVEENESNQAYTFVKNKQWQMAEKAYLELLKSHDSSQARADLAYVYYKKKSYNKALQQLEIALTKKPVYLAAYYYRAKTYSRLERLGDAEKDYLFFIQKLPGHYYARFNLGLIKYNQKHYTQATEIFKLASTLSPGKNKSKALNYLAKGYKHMGEEFYPQARKSFESSIRISPGEVDPRLGIASLLPDTKQGRAEAEEIYEQILNLKPNEPRAHSRLASIYKKQGLYQEAQAAYEKAIEFNPSYISARYNLGLLLLKKKKWQEAIDQFQAITIVDSSHAKAYFNLGRANFRLNNYEQALTYYQKALDIQKGNYPEVAINIGSIYSAKKDYDKAISIYRSALIKDPKSSKLHYNLGLAYIKSGKDKKAMSSYLLAIKYNPDYAQAWYNIAKIHTKNEKFKDAVTAYKKSLKLKPNYRSAQLNLAVALTRLGDLKQAEKIYRQVLLTSPRYFSAWLNLGLVLLDQHRYSEAEDILYQASELDTEDHKVISLLAKAQLNQGKKENAEQHYRIALDMKPDSHQYRLGYIRVLIQQKKYDVAKEETTKGIKLFPESAQLTELNNTIKQLNTKH